jgi:putative DNA primase/helicase
VPFEVAIPPDQVVPDFDAILLREASGILRWMVEGCLKWQRLGLALPKSVRRATRRYQKNEDTVGTFLSEAGFKNPCVPRTAIYSTYGDWVQDQGLKPLSAKRLYEILRSKGFREKKVNGTIHFDGLPTGGTPWRAQDF